MYVEALEDGMTVSFTNKATSGSLYYSLDKQEWNELTGETPVVNSGEKVYFKGVDLVPASYKGIGTFAINKQSSVAGNIMSLLFVDDFVGKTDLTGYDFAFYELFKNCTTIQSAEKLIIHANTLARDCYGNMFSGCKNLTSVPELPATILAKYCYSQMFYGCTNLTTTPELPATVAVTGCYNGMFNGCTSLITTPSLPATELALNCYNSMFYGCTSLTSALELPATELASSCYANMFYGCTSLTTAPELPATVLANSCYYCMFATCTNLNYIKMLATDISASGCLNYWVPGVSSTGTFVKAEGVEIPIGISGIPEGWTVQTV